MNVHDLEVYILLRELSAIAVKEPGRCSTRGSVISTNFVHTRVTGRTVAWNIKKVKTV